MKTMNKNVTIYQSKFKTSHALYITNQNLNQVILCVFWAVKTIFLCMRNDKMLQTKSPRQHLLCHPILQSVIGL